VCVYVCVYVCVCVCMCVCVCVCFTEIPKHENISISLPAVQIEEIDKIRGMVSRSKYISYLLEKQLDLGKVT